LKVGVNISVLNDNEIVCFEQRNKHINIVAIGV